MFTGLIEEIGKVESIIKGGKSAQLTIGASKVLENIKQGDSISTNGICLTVTTFTKTTFTVDIMPETMQRSNLNDLKYGSKVNLERALKLDDRLNGHLVSGHIDGIGKIKAIEKDDNATWLTIQAPPNILKYIIEKGSVAIDGTSLTVASVDNVSNEIFKVSIIPLTREKTTLLSKIIGEKVNLECDLIGKYVERFLVFNEDLNQAEEQKTSLDLNFLRENGFA
ncbi:MAG: riboflavin synthase [Clostridia bacterium]|nr:riboflavin synthase [Clostridia bacterium]